MGKSLGLCAQIQPKRCDVKLTAINGIFIKDILIIDIYEIFDTLLKIFLF